MDPRRMPRAVSDPKVRHVGFFTPAAAPDLSQSGAPAATSSSPPFSDVSPSGTTLSPVMIPLPRHHSNDLPRHLPHAPPLPRVADTSIPVGSYNPSEFLSATSTEDFPDEPLSPGWTRGNGSGKFATSLPAGGFDMPLAKQNNGKEQKAVSGKTLKEKTTKAERRAMQEAQRAAKAAARGEGSKTSAAAASASGVNPANANIGKPVKAVSQKKDSSSVAASEKKGGDRQPDKDRKKDVPHPRMQFDDANRVEKAVSQKKDSSSVAASEKKGGDRQPDKDRKKDVPHPRMQFDDANRVEKAKKRSVVKQTEARNRVELFRHLPQYEHGTQLPDLESKFFQLDSIHPAVYNVGLRYLAADISGGNARCIAMLQAFQESMKDYSTPPQKSLIRDLTTKISGYVSFLTECRPLSISMGNAIRFLKTRIEELPLNLSESEVKANLIADIEHFISEKIILADKVIVKHAVTKIRDGDVLLTYASSSAVEMLLLHAHELGKQFRVVIVDSRPKLEGQKLLRRLVGKGINCTYTHVNALSYIMHEVTRVFLGASSVLSNGTVYSRVGTACVAMVAHQFRVPVLICCEAYKFHIRVQLDSICSNELGDPDAISKVSGRKEINSLDGWANSENLQLLNLIYDATPSDYVSMIITDYGMIPPTSVPVIVREYQKDHLWIYS